MQIRSLSPRYKGLALLMLAQIILGTSTIFIKQLTEVFPISWLVLARFSVSTIIFGTVILLSNTSRTALFNLKPKIAFWLFMIGIIGSGAGAYTYYLSISRVGIGLGAILANLEVPLSILWASIFLKEKLSIQFIKIALITLTGFFMLQLKNGLNIEFDPDFVVGMISGLTTALLWSATTIIGKSLLKEKISPEIIAFMRGLGGAITSVFITHILVDDLYSYLSLLRPKSIFQLLYLSIVATIIAFVLYYRAMKLEKVKYFALFSTLMPISSLITGLFFGERFSILQIIGIILILTGVTLTLRLRDGEKS